MNIEDRLLKLEIELAQANRRIRWLTCGALLCLAAWVGVWTLAPRPLLAQVNAGVPKEITANKFVVIDSKGNRRAMLGISDDVPIIALMDEKGKLRIGLASTKDGPSLELYDDRGTMRTCLAQTKLASALSFLDERGKLRAKLMQSELGPMFFLSDSTGAIRLKLDVPYINGQMGEDPSLSLLDLKGMDRARLNFTSKSKMTDALDGLRNKMIGETIQRDGTSSLSLCDESGANSARLITDNSSALLSLHIPKNNSTVAIDASEVGPKLSLIEKGCHRASLGASVFTTPEGKTISYPASTLLLRDSEGKTLRELP